MINKQDFKFISHFWDFILGNRKKSDYYAMLDKSFSQLESGDVVVKSMDELRAMELV